MPELPYTCACGFHAPMLDDLIKHITLAIRHDPQRPIAHVAMLRQRREEMEQANARL